MLNATRASTCLLALCIALLASGAGAQAPAASTAAARVEHGIALYDEGDFEGAAAEFDAAEAVGLDRAQLVEILSRRVLIAHAASDTAALEANALRLVSLDPDALQDQASPGLVRALEEARANADGVIRLHVAHEVVDDQLALRARIEGDAAGMVREIRFRARRGDGEMVEAVNGLVTVPGTSTDGVVLVADCVGPGGAVLAALGSDGEPYALSAEVAAQILEGGAPPAGDDTALHIGLVLGSVVLVAAAVIVAVIVVDANATTAQLSGPIVEW